MKVQFQTGQCVGKTAIKRKAERVLRVLNSEFPVISSTKLTEFNSTKRVPRFAQYAEAVLARIKGLVREPAWKAFNKGKDDGFYQTFIETVKTHKAGNCGDSSKLFNLLGHLNGIESKKVGMLMSTPNGRLAGEIDHAIHALSTSEKGLRSGLLSELGDVLIIDPWLGIAEYAPKYNELIKTSYNRFIGVPEGYKVILNPYTYDDPEVTQSLTEVVRKKYPQFFIKDGQPLFPRKNDVK